MNRFSTLWYNFTSPITSSDEDGPCSVCCGFDFTSLSKTYGGGLRGPFRVNVRLSDLKPNINRCVTCTVILVGLDKIGPVLKDDRPEEVVLRCSIVDGQPMRMKVYLRGNTEPVSELEFFTTKGSPRTIDAFGQTTYVYRNPLSQESIARVRGWIEDCQSTHPRCRSSRSGTLPWRIIDVGTSPSDDPVLVETFGDQTGDYVALSHCWGKHRPLITTTDSLDRRKAGIKWFSLPQTFQDAILFTRKLGLKYLWIDSLCILQDDDEDWSIEAMRMGGIFENSYVTLAATSAPDSTYGCVGSQDDGQRAIELTNADVPGLRTSIGVRLFRGTTAHSWLTATEIDETQSVSFPLLTRGWCFQERLLASRVVHYTNDEIVFECKTRCQCECGGADLSLKAFYVPLTQHRTNSELEHIHDSATDLNLKRTASDLLTLSTSISSLHNQVVSSTQGLDKQRWRMLVQHYCTRNFSFQKDVLSALSALAQRYRGARVDHYIAGLWKSNLPLDLLWYSEKPIDSYRPVDQPLREKDHHVASPTVKNEAGEFLYTAPSFSWASRVGPIAFLSTYESSRTSCTLLNAEVTPRTRDNFGELESGQVVLQGSAIRYVCRRTSADLSLFANLFTSRDPSGPQGAVRLDTDNDAHVARKARLMLLCVVKDEPQNLYRPIRIAVALILAPCHDQPGTFRRLGLLEWCDASIFDNAKEEIVTIV